MLVYIWVVELLCTELMKIPSSSLLPYPSVWFSIDSMPAAPALTREGQAPPENIQEEVQEPIWEVAPPREAPTQAPATPPWKIRAEEARLAAEARDARYILGAPKIPSRVTPEEYEAHIRRENARKAMAEWNTVSSVASRTRTRERAEANPIDPRRTSRAANEQRNRDEWAWGGPNTLNVTVPSGGNAEQDQEHMRRARLAHAEATRQAGHLEKARWDAQGQAEVHARRRSPHHEYMHMYEDASFEKKSQLVHAAIKKGFDDLKIAAEAAGREDTDWRHIVPRHTRGAAFHGGTEFQPGDTGLHMTYFYDADGKTRYARVVRIEENTKDPASADSEGIPYENPTTVHVGLYQLDKMNNPIIEDDEGNPSWSGMTMVSTLEQLNGAIRRDAGHHGRYGDHKEAEGLNNRLKFSFKSEQAKLDRITQAALSGLLDPGQVVLAWEEITKKTPGEWHGDRDEMRNLHGTQEVTLRYAQANREAAAIISARHSNEQASQEEALTNEINETTAALRAELAEQARVAAERFSALPGIFENMHDEHPEALFALYLSYVDLARTGGLGEEVSPQHVINIYNNIVTEDRVVVRAEHSLEVNTPYCARVRLRALDIELAAVCPQDRELVEDDRQIAHDIIEELARQIRAGEDTQGVTLAHLNALLDEIPEGNDNVPNRERFIFNPDFHFEENVPEVAVIDVEDAPAEHDTANDLESWEALSEEARNRLRAIQDALTTMLEGGHGTYAGDRYMEYRIAAGAGNLPEGITQEMIDEVWTSIEFNPPAQEAAPPAEDPLETAQVGDPPEGDPEGAPEEDVIEKDPEAGATEETQLSPEAAEYMQRVSARLDALLLGETGDLREAVRFIYNQKFLANRRELPEGITAELLNETLLSYADKLAAMEDAAPPADTASPAKERILIVNTEYEDAGLVEVRAQEAFQAGGIEALRSYYASLEADPPKGMNLEGLRASQRYMELKLAPLEVIEGDFTEAPPAEDDLSPEGRQYMNTIRSVVLRYRKLPNARDEVAEYLDKMEGRAADGDLPGGITPAMIRMLVNQNIDILGIVTDPPEVASEPWEWRHEMPQAPPITGNEVLPEDETLAVLDPSDELIALGMLGSMRDPETGAITEEQLTHLLDAPNLAGAGLTRGHAIRLLHRVNAEVPTEQQRGVEENQGGVVSDTAVAEVTSALAAQETAEDKVSTERHPREVLQEVRRDLGNFHPRDRAERHRIRAALDEGDFSVLEGNPGAIAYWTVATINGGHTEAENLEQMAHIWQTLFDHEGDLGQRNLPDVRERLAALAEGDALDAREITTDTVDRLYNVLSREQPLRDIPLDAQAAADREVELQSIQARMADALTQNLSAVHSAEAVLGDAAALELENLLAAPDTYPGVHIRDIYQMRDRMFYEHEFSAGVQGIEEDAAVARQEVQEAAAPFLESEASQIETDAAATPIIDDLLLKSLTSEDDMGLAEEVRILEEIIPERFPNISPTLIQDRANALLKENRGSPSDRGDQLIG
jgi:hypothetical protein